MNSRFVFSLFTIALFLPSLASAKLDLISEKKYAALNSLQQTWYTHELQSAWLQFELAYPKAGELNDHSIWQKILFTEAVAASAPKCVVGGVALGTKVVNGKTVCNTQSRPCTASNDGYLCGSIMASLCVPRTPTRSLSPRCASIKPTTKSALTPKQYSAAKKETESNYETLCADKTANTQDACNKLPAQITEIANSPQLTAAPSDTPDSGVASIKACSFNLNPGGTGLQLPKFGFSQEHACLYQNNQTHLERIATSGCASSGHKVGNELFLTRFRSINDNYLFNTSNVFDSIIEDVSVMQNNGPNDITYNVRMLKPNTQSSPVRLERTTVQVKVTNGQHFLCLPDCAIKQEPIKIENAVRSNILPEKLKAISRTAMDSLMDGKVMLAKNCMLANQLTSNNLYSAKGNAQSPVTAPKKAGGTR